MDSQLLIGTVVGLLAIIGVLVLVIVHLKKRHESGKTGTQTLAANLRDEKMRSNVILNSIDDGVVLISSDGVIQMFNPGAVAITGWPEDEATELDWHNVLKLVNEK